MGFSFHHCWYAFIILLDEYLLYYVEGTNRFATQFTSGILLMKCPIHYANPDQNLELSTLSHLNDVEVSLANLLDYLITILQLHTARIWSHSKRGDSLLTATHHQYYFTHVFLRPSHRFRLRLIIKYHPIYDWSECYVVIELSNENSLTIEYLLESIHNFLLAVQELLITMPNGVSTLDRNDIFRMKTIYSLSPVLNQCSDCADKCHLSRCNVLSSAVSMIILTDDEDVSQFFSRDLKPQNLLISDIGELKLADFGKPIYPGIFHADCDSHSSQNEGFDTRLIFLCYNKLSCTLVSQLYCQPLFSNTRFELVLIDEMGSK